MERRGMIDPQNSLWSVRQQCKLLALNRSSIYYEAVGENAYNLSLMKILDEEYTCHPFKGAVKMVDF